jgi:hypothetical protein
LVELEEKLPQFLEGKTTAASADERIELAQLCSVKHQYQASARFYEEAFAVQSKLLADQRYNAACAAAQAGCGRGEDASRSDDWQRKRLRTQALHWLRDELAACIKQSQSNPKAPRQTLAHWQSDSDLAGVRDAEPLAQLPREEQEEWRQFWKEVARVLERGPKIQSEETTHKEKSQR